MAIEFACQECGKHLRARDELAGQLFRCPRCKLISAVPFADEPHRGPVVFPAALVRPVWLMPEADFVLGVAAGEAWAGGV